MKNLTANIDLLVFDFDGVMTNNRVFVSEKGEESVLVNRSDGLGIKILSELGVKMLILSTEKNHVVARRAEKLKLRVIYGVDNKADALVEFCKKEQIDLKKVAFVGNDINDLAVMQMVGLRIVPSDAYCEVKKTAHIILHTEGGGGVVREVAKRFENERLKGYEASLNVKKIINNEIEVLSVCLKKLQEDEYVNEIIKICDIIYNAVIQGNTVFFCGNGGSAADSQHLAAEFVGRFKKERRSYPAEALTVNTSILTALANDYSFDMIFARQVEALCNKGDVLVGLSTSGNSSNVLQAFLQAQKNGVKTIAITGNNGDKMQEVTDHCLCLPADDTPRIQEMTILVGHMICGIVEEELCRNVIE